MHLKNARGKNVKFDVLYDRHCSFLPIAQYAISRPMSKGHSTPRHACQRAGLRLHGRAAVKGGASSLIISGEGRRGA